MAGQPLRGLVGQGMSGRKANSSAQLSPLSTVDVATGSGTLTATRNCWALIYLQGAGGSGEVGGSGRGGGGGAALFKRVRLSAGKSITYSVGAGGAVDGGDGGNTTATLPSGAVLTAGGGLGGASRTGGVASGGDINRNGGAGGTSSTSGGASAGETPTFGGTGGTPGVNSGGGGGGAGFSDLGTAILGGAGRQGDSSLTAPSPGGGSGGIGGSTGAGGAGRVLIWLVRAS